MTEELIRFRTLVEDFTDVSHDEYAHIGTFVSTNSTILELCETHVEQPTDNLDDEAEVCYILLRALSSLVVSTRSPLPAAVIRRSEALVAQLKPSLQKAQICCYLYCLSQDSDYKEQANVLLDRCEAKKRKTHTEEKTIRECRMII